MVQRSGAGTIQAGRGGSSSQSSSVFFIIIIKGGPTKLPAKGGGQQQRPGKEEPLVGWRKEGASDHHQSWSQFLVGFIHPVRWHPPDNGRLRQAVADAEQPQVGDHPSQPAVWRPHSSSSLLPQPQGGALGTP